MIRTSLGKAHPVIKSEMKNDQLKAKSSHTQLMNSFSQPINQTSKLDSLNNAEKHFSVILILHFAQGLHDQFFFL